MKQRKPLTQSLTIVEYFVEAEYEGRVFSFDGIPDSVAHSRRRNLKRVTRSVQALCTQQQDGKTILIYKAKPKPKLPAPELQTDGQQPTPNETQALHSPESSKHKHNQQKEIKRTKQQKRRQRQRELRRNPSVLTNETECQEPAKAETEEKPLSPLEGSIKFVTDIYNFDNSQLDSIVATYLSDKQWNALVQRSPTLWRLRSSDIKYQHFKDHNEMEDLVQDLTKKISALKTHSKSLLPLWLSLTSTSTESDDYESALSVRMDRLRLNYVSRILPLLVDAAESRRTKLEKRAQSAAQAHRKFEFCRDAACSIDAQGELKTIRDKLKGLVRKSPAWNEVREEGKQLEGWEEYIRVLRLQYQAWGEYCKLLMPELYQDDDTNSEGLDNDDEIAAPFG